MLSQTVFAHEEVKTVGAYKLAVGWMTEPVLEGQMNGIDLQVTNVNSQKPIEGLQDTLKLEITHVDTATVKVFDIEATENPGQYSKALLITSPGEYRFRFFGKIESLAVNETFTTLEGVETADEIQFPIQLASQRELDGAARGAQTASAQASIQAKNAADDAKTARTFAVAGMALGAVGLASSLIILMASRKRK